MEKQKIVLVGAYAPSRLGLNEYTYYIAQALIRDPNIELTVLADEIPARAKSQIREVQGFKIIRCWKYNSPFNFIRILREIKKIKPGLVFFNLLFSSFGDKRIAAALGLLAPVFTSYSGFYTIVLLHHLVEFVPFAPTKFKKLSRVDRIAAHFITQLMFHTDVVLLPLNKYVMFVKRKYAGKIVHKWPHGFYNADELEPGNLQNRNILVFGKFGSYKTLDFAIEVFQKVKSRVPDARLVIGGRSHPSCPDYIENLRLDYKTANDIIFTGYVSEEKLPDLFRNSRLMFLPYTATTGVSGVAHWACCYGLPLVAASLHDLQAMCREENIVMKFYANGNVDSAADALCELLTNDSLAHEMGSRNRNVAVNLPIWKIVDRAKNRYFKKIEFDRWPNEQMQDS